MFYNDIFDTYSFAPEKAAAYGFENRGDAYVFRKSLPEEDFFAEFVIGGGTIEVNVYEEPDGELYLPFNAVAADGGFVSRIRARAEEILGDIVKNCFELTDVKAILLDYVREKRGTIPNSPWKTFKEYYTLNTAKKGKWYGIFMYIPYSYLKIDKEGKVNVLNLKVKPEDIPKVIDNVHYFPAYHMNKKYWISIVLDKRADVEFIKKLLDDSYQIVEG